jgi:ACS family hexuronate transporter-like MFS transporter
VKKAKIPWTILLRQRQAWPFLIGKLLTDPVWWFFLFWMPSYLHDIRHWSLMASATSLLIPYTAASVGSIFGGWFSSRLIKRGMSVAPARYIAMGICALCMPLSIYAAWAQQSWLAITLLSLALAGHQGWSANIFTTATDMFPQAVAGSVVGLGGTAGAIGGMLMTLLAGAVIQYTHHYTSLFIWAGLMHPLSLVLYVLIVGTRHTHADVAHKKHGLSFGLIIGGVLVAILGAVGLVLVKMNWEHLVQSMKGLSGAAAGAAAAGFVALIGLLLIYAGIDRRSLVPEEQ